MALVANLVRRCGLGVLCLALPGSTYAWGRTPTFPDLVAQAADPGAAVTYTPIRRSGSSTSQPPSSLSPPGTAAQAAPPAALPSAAPATSPAGRPWFAVPAPPAAVVAPAPAAPVYVPVIPRPQGPVAPVYVPIVPRQQGATPTPTRAGPMQAMPGPVPAPLPMQPVADAPAGPPVVAKRALAPASRERGLLGLAIDLGMPDGVNIGPVIAPTRWMRIGASAGSNSAGIDYRGGLSFLPVGFGPSFNFELGHCTVADMNSVLGTFFRVSGWIKPYVQQLGYSYFNAHVGIEYPVGSVMLFLHGGYTYLTGTVRGPNPVVVSRNKDNTPNTTVTAQEGDVSAHTLSAKFGAIVMFGGI